MNGSSTHANGGRASCRAQQLAEHREQLLSGQLHLQDMKLALSCHRQQLQHFFDDWVQQQEGILDDVIRDRILGRPGLSIGHVHRSSNHGHTSVFDDQALVTAANEHVNDLIPEEFLERDHLTTKEDSREGETHESNVCASDDSAAKLRGLATSGMKVHRPFRQNTFDTSSSAETNSNSPQVMGKQVTDVNSDTLSDESDALKRSSRSMHSMLGFSGSEKLRSAVMRKSLRNTKMASFLHHDSQGSVNAVNRSFLSNIVASTKFESMCAAVICANAVVMGISADYDMKHLSEPDHVVLAHLELAFTIFYTVEVCLRIAVYGIRMYLCGLDWKWNLFDVALIFMAVFDRVQSALSLTGDVGGQNLSFLRMLRLFKMMRLLRMIRLMKMFRELRLILYSMLGSMQAMLWASLLVLIISYMVGICLLQGCTNYLKDTGPSGESQQMILEYWSSIGQAILSLFMATTGGEDWSRIAAPLKQVGWVFSAIFISYVAFFILVVMNTVTSLFVDSVMENSSRDQQAIIQTELDKKDMYVGRLQTFFNEIDEDGVHSSAQRH